MTREMIANRSVAGIDVSKTSLDLFIDPDGICSHIDNDEPARARLILQLRDANVALVLIEATGRHHRRIAADLLEAGIPVAVVNPQRAREFARSMGKLEKTDAIDAKMLADFARARTHLLMPKPREKQAELDDLVSRRRALVRVRIAEKNRLADDLPKLAKRQAKTLLRLVDQQIEDLDRAIAKLIEADDDWNNKSEIIESIPGVGATSAHQLIAELPELGNVDRGEIAKLAGVAPLCKQSGKLDGQRSIQGGRADARTALYMAAFNAMQHNPRFKAFAERLKAKGKKFKVIVTACMRKLLTILNQMIKTNTRWNENLAFNFH